VGAMVGASELTTYKLVAIGEIVNDDAPFRLMTAGAVDDSADASTSKISSES
jgi:hypothetical protein